MVRYVKCFRLNGSFFIRFRFLWMMIVAALLTFGCSSANVQVSSPNILPDHKQDTSQIQTDYPELNIYSERDIHNIGNIGGDVILGNLAVKPVEDLGAEENEPESQLQKNTRIIQVNRCHKEELVGMLWLSIPEPNLIEDPFLEGVCAESATTWCDPDFEDIYLSYLEQEKKLKLEASIFPNFVSPVDNGIVLRGMQLPTKKRRRGHYGLDIIPASLEGRGTPIKAVEGGVVIKKSRARGYGHYVVLYHQSGFFSLYSHLLKDDQVKVGQEVQRGETIGHMGKSGNARGYHLHFELIDLREIWDFKESIDVFIEALCCGCVEKCELNQFSKLLFNKQSRKDPLPNIPGLVMAKKVKGKWVPVGQLKAQAQTKK
jgi:hypothetical protein